MASDGALHARQQLPLLSSPARPLPGQRYSVPLRIVRIGVWRRSGVPGGARLRVATQCLRLFEVPARSVCAAPAARSHRAGGRLPLFQRLRPARGAQGTHGIDRMAPLRPIPQVRQSPAVRRIRLVIRPASSAAISSASRTSSRSISTFSTIPSARASTISERARRRHSMRSRRRRSMPVARSRARPALPFTELHRAGAIEYVPFPPALVGKYQSFTQADLSRLRAAGYTAPLLPVEEGVARCVRTLLASPSGNA